MTVLKIEGNYNIVENVLNFADAPIGPTPIGTPTNPPDRQRLDRSYNILHIPR